MPPEGLTAALRCDVSASPVVLPAAVEVLGLRVAVPALPPSLTADRPPGLPVLLPSFRVMQITRRGGVLRPLRSSQHGGQVGIEQISPLGTGARLWPFGL